MQAAKWTLIILGSLLLVLVATVLVLTSVVDPNHYRAKIESIVGERVGRPLVIEGKLEITWFPWLGVRTGASHLANSPGEAGPPIVEWQSIAVAAKVWPLLHGQLVIDRIRLESPHVRLHRDARGHGNWEDLTARAAPRSAGQSTSGSASPSSGPSIPQVAGLEIHNGSIAYVDDASGLRGSLSSLDFQMGEWRAGKSLPIHTRFLVNGGSLPPKGVWVEVDTPALMVGGGGEPSAGVGMPSGKGTSLLAQGAASRPALGSTDGVVLRSTDSGQPADAGSRSADTGSLVVTAPQLVIKIVDAEIRGDVGYRQVDGRQATAGGSLTAHAPSLRKLSADLGLNQTLPHDPTTLGELNLTASWRYENGLLAAKPIAVKLDGITLEGWLERSAVPRLGWRFQLHGDRIDLGRYINADSSQGKPFELEMLKTIKANGSLSFDEAQLADTHMSDVHLRVETPETEQ